MASLLSENILAEKIMACPMLCTACTTHEPANHRLGRSPYELAVVRAWPDSIGFHDVSY
jgi:hypothetical protein